MTICILLISLIYLTKVVLSQNCPLITNDELQTDISTVRFSGDGSQQTVLLSDFTINCQVVGTVKDTYSTLSITVFYRNPATNMDEIARITLDCLTDGVDFDWQPDILSVLDSNNVDPQLIIGDTMNCFGCKGLGNNGNFECEGRPCDEYN